MSCCSDLNAIILLIIFILLDQEESDFKLDKSLLIYMH